ncbi:MAG TPA: LPS export ABC transporter permease LptF [Gammaproteobacteria bacterium]|nr:LPS export ABC transporter permease LptF [Gammaproteobacteria bacterium]
MTLYKYFAKDVLFTMVAVAFIVLVISMGWRFSGYLNQAAGGTLSSDVLFLLMGYRLPGFLELIVPVSFFLSLMLVYGRMYVDSEMIVMESCGIGPGRLVFITLLLALFVMVVTAIISLWLKPEGELRTELLMAGQRNMTEFDTLAPGRFQTVRSGKRVTYAEELSGEGNLAKVFMSEYEGAEIIGLQEVTTMVAQSGETQVDEFGNRFLVLTDGTRYTGKPGSPGFRVINYREYGQMIEQEQARQRIERLAGIPTAKLLESDDPRNMSELHWRIAMVVMIPIMALIAVPLSRVNPRQGRLSKLMPGMFLCFLYVGSLAAAKTGIERENIPLSIGLWWIHGIFLFVAVTIFKTPALLNRFRRMIKHESTG